MEEIKLKGKGGVSAFDVSHDGKFLAVAQHGLKKNDALLSLLDASTYKLLGVLEKFDENSLHALAFDKDGHLLYSKDNYAVHVLDVQTGETVNSVNTRYNRGIIASRYSHKAISLGSYLEVFDVDREELLFRLDGYEAFQITEPGKISGNVSWLDKKPNFDSFIAAPPVACFSTQNDNRVYFTGVNTTSIIGVDLETRQTETLIPDGVLQAKEIKISSADRYLAVSSQMPQGDFVWEIPSGKRVAPSLISDKYRSSSAFGFHPTAPVLASGSRVGYLTIIDLEKEEILYSENIHGAAINQVQFIENGARVLTAGSDGKLKVTAFPG